MKPIHYIIGSITFCLLFAVIVAAVVFSNKASCSLQTVVLDSGGNKLKTWDKGKQASCFFLDLGCKWSCESWCQKNLNQMTEAAKNDSASNAETIAYNCGMTTDAEENNRFPNLMQGDINLRAAP
jgi:hypothetical protein